MFLTMLISGLWHGAAWRFVIWGTLHAIGRFATREFERSSFYAEKIPRFVKQLCVFTFVTFAWIFFRADNLQDALTIVRRIGASGFTNPQFPLFALALCLSVWAYQFLFESRAKKVLSWAPVRVGIVVSMLLYLVIFSSSSNAPFQYFQF